MSTVPPTSNAPPDPESDSDEEEAFGDDEGEQPLAVSDNILNRDVRTTPYDAPVRTLIQEIEDKSLIVNPQFQRRDVWDSRRKSRLIESLLLNIPIPVLYFAEDEDGTRVVVDGQQRLRSIEEFRAGILRLAHLQVLPQLNGKRWADLSAKETRSILSRTLRCVVISASSDPLLRFEMFERLNTGGVPLNDQELRNCVLRGPLNDLLDTLVRTDLWLTMVNKATPNHRMRHHELALRFFALSSRLNDYRPPLKQFMTDYMTAHRNASPAEIEGLRRTFSTTLVAVGRVFKLDAFKRYGGVLDTARWERNLNRAVFDVQMLSFAGLGPNFPTAEQALALQERFKQLCLADQDFAASLALATADRSKFLQRLRIWGNAMAELGIAPLYLHSLPER